MREQSFPVEAKETRGGPPGLGVILPLLLTALVIFQLGYSYGEPNHTLLLPWILRRVDPTLLVNDWFSNTIPHHLNSVVVMAWLGRVISVPLASVILHVLTVLFLVAVMHRVVARLFDDWRVLLMALFLFFRWGTEGLGGNSLWSNYTLPHYVAVPFCLLAFCLSLEDKPVAAAVASAVATWIHIQLGALTMLVLGIGMLFQWRTVGWRKIFSSGAVYFALAAATLGAQWRLYVAEPSPLSPRDFLYLHAILRQPHHLIPSSWSVAEYYHFFLVVAMAIFGGAWREQPHRTVLTWCSIILALCVAGTVFVELVPVKLIIKLQAFRMTIFVKFFAVLYAARFLLDVAAGRETLRKLCALAILAIQNYAAAGLCFALILALRRAERWVLALGLFAAGAATAIAVVVATSGNIAKAWAPAVTLSGVWVGLLTLAVLSMVAWRRPQLLPAALIAVVVVIRVATGPAYFGYDHPPADDWRRFCRQIRSSTPRDAVFLTPPTQSGFQVFAERAEVANFKCTPSIERDLLEWKRRMDDLAGSEVRCSGWLHCAAVLDQGYRRLHGHDFQELARKYGAQYVVTAYPEQRLNFPEALRLGDWILYRVP